MGIKPSQYKLEDLEHYDKPYLWLVVEYLDDEVRKWKAKYEELAAKKSTKSTRHKESAEDKARLLAEGLAFGRQQKESEK